jgi:hypothetical protein
VINEKFKYLTELKDAFKVYEKENQKHSATQQYYNDST